MHEERGIKPSYVNAYEFQLRPSSWHYQRTFKMPPDYVLKTRHFMVQRLDVLRRPERVEAFVQNVMQKED